MVHRGCWGYNRGVENKGMTWGLGVGDGGFRIGKGWSRSGVGSSTAALGGCLN